MSKLFRAIKSKSRVIHAIFIRSILSEHGVSKIGYITALTKPLGQIVIFTTMFTLLGRSTPIGDNLTLFIATGIIPYNLCMGLANKIPQINKSHRALINHTIATPLDITVAVLLAESIILFISTVIILLILGHFDYWDYTIDSLSGILIAAIFSIALGYSVGLINSSIFMIYPPYEKIWKILSMPLFIISGVFFIADQRFPSEVIEILKYNPLLHIIESMRDNFYKSWESALFDLKYVLWFILYTTTIGLLSQELTKKKSRL